MDWWQELEDLIEQHGPEVEVCVMLPMNGAYDYMPAWQVSEYLERYDHFDQEDTHLCTADRYREIQREFDEEAKDGPFCRFCKSRDGELSKGVFTCSICGLASGWARFA